MRRRIPPEVTVSFLELVAPPPHGKHLPAGCTVSNAPGICVKLYRHLYETIGLDYLWVERLRMSDARLEARIHAADTEIHLLRQDGRAIGFAEVTFEAYPDVELIHFGLIPDAMGKGLGRAFLQHVIGVTWTRFPDRVLVQTSTLDHPAALCLYQSCGFVAYDRVTKRTHELV